MDKSNKLSIIIVNYRTYDFLDNCLKSIYLSKLGKYLYEIIVIDNNSNDKSVSKISKNHKRIKLIKNKENKGFSFANNQGVKISDGQYLLFLNPDTIVSKDVINKLIKYLDNNSDVGIVSPKIVLSDGSLDDACHRGFPTPWNAFCHFAHLGLIFPKSSFFNGYHLGYRELDNIHEIDACSGACMMVRRKAGDEINWLDEDYFWYGEDLDFCFRIKKRKWKVMFYPKAIITHYKGISSGIKKHSQHMTVADKKTIKLAQTARHEVMRIFYKKHYGEVYPRWLTGLVMFGIKVKEYVSLFTFKMTNF